MHHLGAGESEGTEGLGFGHAAADGDGPGAEQEARLGDEVVGVDGDLDSRLGEDGGVLFEQAHGFGLSAGTVEERERDPGAVREFVGNQVAFGAVLEHEFEAKLVGEAQGGHDVVGAMGVEVDGALALQDFDERFEGEVAIRGEDVSPFLTASSWRLSRC